jgi:hypothetical protein
MSTVSLKGAQATFFPTRSFRALQVDFSPSSIMCRPISIRQPADGYPS